MKMKFRRLIQATSITGVAIFMMAVSASATQISFNTNTTGTEFTASSGGTISGGGLILSDSTGDAATLTYLANTGTTVTVPTNIDFGNFILACPSCTTSAGGTFGAFTFDIIVDDTSDGATGKFIGTSSGGTFTSNSSTISINWSTTSQPPVQLGAGAVNALTGNFGQTYFTINTTSAIVAPNQGVSPGETTIQGFVSSIPEPGTLGLAGAALLGLGMLRRKKVSRQ
jgi:hypothetical protein